MVKSIIEEACKTTTQYRFGWKDFVPILGLVRYTERTKIDEGLPQIQWREGLLMLYTVANIVAGVKGLELLAR